FRSGVRNRPELISLGRSGEPADARPGKETWDALRAKAFADFFALANMDDK
ncbi:unnamed protein product, partial [Nesidiocoris tenuis]